MSGRHPDAIRSLDRKEAAISNEKTMKLVTNLDRAAIEASREVGGDAAAAGLTDVVRCSSACRACRAAHIQQRVNNAIERLVDKPQHARLAATSILWDEFKNLSSSF